MAFQVVAGLPCPRLPRYPDRHALDYADLSKYKLARLATTSAVIKPSRRVHDSNRCVVPPEFCSVLRRIRGASVDHGGCTARRHDGM
jgi:hypothetical protein